MSAHEAAAEAIRRASAPRLGIVLGSGLGAVAGTGISIAFSLMLRGFLIAGAARRDGRKGLALANGAMGAVFAVVCLLAVVGGLLALLHR